MLINCSYNTPFWPFDLPTVQTLAIAILIAILIPLTFFTNSLLIMALINCKQLTNITNYLYLCLSISDCVLAVVTLPLTIYAILINTCYYVVANSVITKVNVRTSNYTIFLIAIQRYIITKLDLRNPTPITAWITSKTGTTVILLSLYLIALLRGILNLIQSVDLVIVRLMFTITENLGSLVIGILYMRLYTRVKSSALERTVRRSAVPEETPLYVKRLRKTVFLILVTLAVCYLPFVFLRVTWAVMEKAKHHVSHDFKFAMAFFVVLFRLNSTLNAVIVISRNRVLRAYARKKICWFSSLEGTVNCQSHKISVGPK